MNFRLFWATVLFSFATVLPAQVRISLLFVGDAMQHLSQIESAACDTGFNYVPCFQWVKDEISAADFAVANLESPLGGKPYAGYPVFSAPDEYARALKDAGFDLFLLANNHILDCRSTGLLRTLNVLDSMKIGHTGVYRNVVERGVSYPYMVNCKGIRIAFLNYTYGTNGFKPAAPCIVNYIDRETMLKEVKYARELGAEVIIACMHWGEEYVLYPNQEQKTLADLLVDNGVDLVIGSHPHVLQPMEWRKPESGKSSVIAYSLGNFISNMQIQHTTGGAMLKVVLQKDMFKPVRIDSADYSLVFTQRPPGSGTPHYILLPAARFLGDSSKVTSDVQLRMKQFVHDARKLLDNYNKGIKEYKF